MATLASPLSLNPAITAATRGAPAPANPIPVMTAGAPGAQLLSTGKTQRIDVWRTEVSSSDITCVCSMRTSSSPTATGAEFSSATSRPIAVPIVRPSTAGALGYIQASPASSFYSTSDVYASTQATSPLSSTFVGLLMEGKADLCPQCGIQKGDIPECGENEGIDLAGEFGDKEQPNPPLDSNKSRKIWTGFKNFARKLSGRVEPQTLKLHKQPSIKPRSPGLKQSVTAGRSGLNLHNFAFPNLGSSAPEPPLTPIHIGTTDYPGSRRRISVNIGSPLQLFPSASPSQGSASRTGENPRIMTTQMYSSLRRARTDDSRLMEIVGKRKFATASPLLENDDLIGIGELEREVRENPEMKRLRERAERLEKGRRMLAQSAPGPGGKRPASYSGIGALGMKF